MNQLEQIINKSLEKGDEISVDAYDIWHHTTSNYCIRIKDEKELLTTQIRKAYEAGVKETKEKLTLEKRDPAKYSFNAIAYNQAVQDLENLKKEI